MESERANKDTTRYDLMVPYQGMGRFGWAFLLLYVWFIFWGSFPVKAIFGSLLLLHAATLLFRHEQFAEVLPDRLRIQLGYGPSMKITYREIARIGTSVPKLGPLSRLVTTLAQVRWPGSQPFNYGVEIELARRKWVLLLTPIPFLWPSKKLRLAILDGPSFVADVTRQLGTANR